MSLPFNLRDQLLNVVQTSAHLQSHFVGTGLVRSGSSWLLYLLQSGTKGFIHNPTKRAMQFVGQRSRPIQNIVFYG